MINKMVKKYTRSYLEALSFSDLIAVANEQGIDVPDNLNRNFLIAEILEFVSDNRDDADDDIVNTVGYEGEEIVQLPEMYNTTEIEMVLQNPVWAFVFLNISDTDMQVLKSAETTSIFLRVSSFDKIDSAKPLDSFDIKISLETKEQYLLLPSDSEFVAVELYARINNKETRFATSRIVERPRSNLLDLLAVPGEKYELSDVMELSGARKLLHKHYVSYRQLFS